MTARLPRPARDVLERGTLCHLAVSTSWGPHLTPVVYALDGGRIWLTTSRTSVKSRALRRNREVAGMIRVEGEAVTFRGLARTYDALDPLSWPYAAVAGPRLVRAATRFSVKNARFFAGYAVDARRVPFAWTPPGRVFVGIEVAWGALLDLAGRRVTGAWGLGPPEAGGADEDPVALTLPDEATPAGRRARRGLDLRAPRPVRSALGNTGEGALALERDASTVVPVRWRRVAREGVYEAVVPLSFLGLTGPRVAGRGEPEPGPRAALEIDRLARWRAAEMTGMLLQGEAGLASVEAGDAVVRLRPRRVVWWQGWSTGAASER